MMPQKHWWPGNNKGLNTLKDIAYRWNLTYEWTQYHDIIQTSKAHVRPSTEYRAVHIQERASSR